MTGVKRKTLLVVAVNVALCALLVEGFAAVALRSLHGQWTSSSGYVAAVSGRTEDPGDGAGEPGTGEQEGAAAKLHAPRWMLQPYFGFARNPEAQTHRLAGARVTVPVNDHGLFGPSPLGGQSDGTFHVALAGGSVALELYLYSRQALADELARLPGAAGKEVEIICLALGGLKQPQQVLQLAYFLALGAQYDLVINLDGFNEVALPLAENLPFGVNPFFPRNWIGYSNTAVDPSAAIIVGRLADLRAEQEDAVDRLLTNPLRRTYTGLVAHELGRRRAMERIFALEQELTTLMSEQALGPQQRGPAYDVRRRDRALADLVEVWKRGSLEMWALAEAAGTPYHHFLQPNQYVLDSKPFAPWELAHAITTHAAYASAAIPGYPLLIDAGKELTAAGAPFHDLTMMYADVTDVVYRDNCCHFTQEGGDMLAREIGRRIVSAAEEGANRGGTAR